MTKLKIPTDLNSEMFEIAGYNTKALNLSDRDLGESLAVMECLIRYFKGRGDSQIILRTLYMELSQFESWKRARDLL